MKKHWKVLFIILSIYTIYDYIEHVVRPNAGFVDYPIRWGLFTLASTITLAIVSFFGSKLFNRFIPEIVGSTLGVGLAALLHVTFSGPLWDQLFWMGDLFFINWYIPVFAGMGIYLIYRSIYYTVTHFLFVRRS